MQNSPKSKILIAITLVLFAAILFFIRSGFNKKDENKTGENEIKTEARQYSASDMKKMIPPEIDSILYQYGLKPEWIRNMGDSVKTEKPKKEKQKKTTDKQQKQIVKQPLQGENLLFYKEVTIPKDIPFAELNLEIVNLIGGYKLSSTSFEDPKTYNQVFNIYSSADTSKKVIAKINFLYSDKIKRETADICIVLDKVENYGHSFLEKVLNSSDKYSVMLPDDITKLDLQTMVLESRRDYLVKADIGLQDDIEAEFRSDMKEKDWRAKVRSICYEYDKAAGIILRNPKLQHKMEMELLDEFSKYPVKAYRDTILTKYFSSEKSKKKISDLFATVLSKAKAGITSQVYVVNFSEEDYKNYIEGIHVIKKRGYKFFTFSDLMKRRMRSEAEKNKVENEK
jgi:hypothetical protein